MTFRIASVLLLLTLINVDDASGQSSRLTIYVGPETRDGFVDTDEGVSDSVKDLVNELKKDKTLHVQTDKRWAADLQLLVLFRTTEANGGMVSVPIGPNQFYLPTSRMLLKTLLRTQAGSYEKPIGFSAGSWRDAAKAVAKDVRAWVAANRERLRQQ